jgi:hypothetical protein
MFGADVHDAVDGLLLIGGLRVSGVEGEAVELVEFPQRVKTLQIEILAEFRHGKGLDRRFVLGEQLGDDHIFA